MTSRVDIYRKVPELMLKNIPIIKLFYVLNIQPIITPIGLTKLWINIIFLLLLYSILAFLIKKF